MRAEAQRTEMTGTRPRQRLRAAQFDDDDGRIEGEEGEGRGDRRPSGWWWYEIKEGSVYVRLPVREQGVTLPSERRVLFTRPKDEAFRRRSRGMENKV